STRHQLSRIAITQDAPYQDTSNTAHLPDAADSIICLRDGVKSRLRHVLPYLLGSKDMAEAALESAADFWSKFLLVGVSNPMEQSRYRPRIPKHARRNVLPFQFTPMIDDGYPMPHVVVRGGIRSKPEITKLMQCGYPNVIRNRHASTTKNTVDHEAHVQIDGAAIVQRFPPSGQSAVMYERPD